MTIESDMPDFHLSDHGYPLNREPDLDSAEILARYWNDQETTVGNVETISWWLRQARKSDHS